MCIILNLRYKSVVVNLNDVLTDIYENVKNCNRFVNYFINTDIP
jgi:hypothetical protein